MRRPSSKPSPSRRAVVRGLAGAAIGGLGASMAGRRVSAGEEASWLLVQTARSGLLTPREGAAGRVELRLRGVGPFVTLFTDRPHHRTAVMPTAEALAAFLEGEPPNAALTTTAAGELVTEILELVSAAYDAGAETVVYEAIELAHTGRPSFHLLGHRRRGTASLAFGHASLVIDGLLVGPGCWPDPHC